MTSRTIIDEWGLLSSPIFLTSSMSVGTVYDAAIRHFIKRDPAIGRDDIFQPVVAECDDSYLSDSRAMPIAREHVEAALADLADGPVPEGCVGAGTGMHAFQFKGGIGTSSRLVTTDTGTFTVGVLTLTNFGRQTRLTVAGAPVGLKLRRRSPAEPPEGSAIVVVATDAPLHPLQCARLAKRAALGLARTGSTGSDGSGELVLAFSTGQVVTRGGAGAFHTLRAPHEGPFIWSGDTLLNQLFEAAVDATEESVLNALFRADSTSGRDGHRLDALPLDDALDILWAHGHPATRP
jgi:D-aminopeptidase